MADPDEEGAEQVDREEEAERDIHEEAGDDVPPRVPRDAALVGAALAARRDVARVVADREVLERLRLLEQPTR